MWSFPFESWFRPFHWWLFNLSHCHSKRIEKFLLPFKFLKYFSRKVQLLDMWSHTLHNWLYNKLQVCVNVRFSLPVSFLHHYIDMHMMRRDETSPNFFFYFKTIRRISKMRMSVSLFSSSFHVLVRNVRSPFSSFLSVLTQQGKKRWANTAGRMAWVKVFPLICAWKKSFIESFKPHN